MNIIQQWYLYMNKNKLLYIRQYHDQLKIESTISNNGKKQYLSFADRKFVDGIGGRFNKVYHVSAIDFIYEEEEKDDKNIDTTIDTRV